MTPDSEMASAHARDYADKRAIEQLADVIRSHLNDPPTRMSTQSRNGLAIALTRLEQDSAHIVSVWD